MERRVIIVDNVEYLLEEKDDELSDDEFLSYDNGEVDHISDYVCSYSFAKSDSEDVLLTTFNYFFSRNKSVCWSSSTLEHSSGRAAAHNVIHATHHDLQAGNIASL